MTIEIKSAFIIQYGSRFGVYFFNDVYESLPIAKPDIYLLINFGNPISGSTSNPESKKTDIDELLISDLNGKTLTEIMSLAPHVETVVMKYDDDGYIASSINSTGYHEEVTKFSVAYSNEKLVFKCNGMVEDCSIKINYSGKAKTTIRTGPTLATE